MMVVREQLVVREHLQHNSVLTCMMAREQSVHLQHNSVLTCMMVQEQLVVREHLQHNLVLTCMMVLLVHLL
tara:strand:+ start:363 stop:575 length:213 start_codon:yes stop_codon:yes gene_type:complete